MKRNRLQVNIFRRMAMIHGDIAESPLPVLAGCPCKDGALSTEVPLSKRGWGSCTNSVAYPGAAFFSMVLPCRTSIAKDAAITMTAKRRKREYTFMAS
jgi:hypothetical protein